MNSVERLTALAGTLRESRERLERLPGGQGLPRAAEWLLDNGYVVQAALRQVKEDLPEGFWRILPRNASGEVKVASSPAGRARSRRGRSSRSGSASSSRPPRRRGRSPAARSGHSRRCCGWRCWRIWPAPRSTFERGAKRATEPSRWPTASPAASSGCAPSRSPIGRISSRASAGSSGAAPRSGRRLPPDGFRHHRDRKALEELGAEERPGRDGRWPPRWSAAARARCESASATSATTCSTPAAPASNATCATACRSGPGPAARCGAIPVSPMSGASR